METNASGEHTSNSKLVFEYKINYGTVILFILPVLYTACSFIVDWLYIYHETKIAALANQFMSPDLVRMLILYVVTLFVVIIIFLRKSNRILEIVFKFIENTFFVFLALFFIFLILNFVGKICLPDIAKYYEIISIFAVAAALVVAAFLTWLRRNAESDSKIDFSSLMEPRFLFIMCFLVHVIMVYFSTLDEFINFQKISFHFKPTTKCFMNDYDRVFHLKTKSDFSIIKFVKKNTGESCVDVLPKSAIEASIMDSLLNNVEKNSSLR